MKKILKLFLSFLKIILVVFVLVESYLLFFRNFPMLSTTKGLLKLSRGLYVIDRHLIQYDDDMSSYHDRLGYRLKPGEFDFGNTEYKNQFRVNSKGLRGEEDDLNSPQIIVLGDSHTLGFSVDHEHTFSGLIKKQTGLKTLNTGMASYGTVREMILLSELDLSHTKTIIIQYCENDYEENLTFLNKNMQLPIMSEMKYKDIVDYHQQSRSYFFGKYFFHYMRVLIMKKQNPKLIDMLTPYQTKNDYKNVSEVNAFLTVIGHFKDSLNNKKIIVFELNGYLEYNDGEFIRELKKEIQKHPENELYKKIVTIDVSEILESKDFYVLDDHLRPKGHSKIVDFIFTSTKLSAGG